MYISFDIIWINIVIANYFNLQQTNKLKISFQLKNSSNSNSENVTLVSMEIFVENIT